MARTLRQSKIIELISKQEIETQDELAFELRKLGFEITQATISRDIKELGLIKVISAETKKSKYAFLENNETSLISKYITIIREAIISIKPTSNLVVIKTIKGAGTIVAATIEKLNLDKVLTTLSSEDSTVIVCEDQNTTREIVAKINDILYE
ncbi:MAG: arginine repressor [Firmicutes bacterium]|nr:arginine repressor [Bacillota bacterium]